MNKYQVIVLAAGYSQNLYPLIHSEPKHLLPIGNKPMLAYVLEYLESFKFKDIIVVGNSTTNAEELTNYLGDRYKPIQKEGHRSNIELYIPDRHRMVVELLPKMAEDGILERDFILYGGDLISDINLLEVLDFHHLNRATMTTVLLNDPKDQEKGKTTAFSNPKDIYMVYGLEKVSNRILCALPNDQLKEEGLKLKTSILCR